MPYFVTKTGLEVFDTARAWGLAVLLNVLTEDEVHIVDSDWAFLVEPCSPIPDDGELTGLAWRILFAGTDVNCVNWKEVFVTIKGQQRQQKINEVRKTLQEKWKSLCSQLKNPANVVKLSSGETLPGSLDPTAFKGLRHASRARYGEDQLKVPREHWALACLGMATCGTYHPYHFSKVAGQRNWLVMLPVPQEVRFSYFRDVQQLLRPSGIGYRGVQNAAAHYAVQLAEQLRQRAAAQGSLKDRFCAIVYFTLFEAEQQTKPSQGSQLNLAPLMEMIQRDPHGSQALFQWMDYCFRLGAADGAEELALAATELVMRWDLDAYERLISVLARIIAREPLRRRRRQDFDAVLYRTRHEALSKTMEVMSHAYPVRGV